MTPRERIEAALRALADDTAEGLAWADIAHRLRIITATADARAEMQAGDL